MIEIPLGVKKIVGDFVISETVNTVKLTFFDVKDDAGKFRTLKIHLLICHFQLLSREI